MYYIVLDLEFNQDMTSITESKIAATTQCPFEIIQIGAVKIDENFKTIATFNRLVKPKIYETINPFIEKLTGITLDQLKPEEGFSDVFKAFSHFIGSKECVFCLWGVNDMKELFRNAHYHQANTALIPRAYINVQPYASLFLNFPKNTMISLKNAVDFLNIPCSEPMHDAYNDAFYTAEVFKKIYNKSMKQEIYHLSAGHPQNTQRKVKRQLDTASLLLQFEKMYDRPLSEKEKEMIKLAYNMGKTQQFLV